MKRLSSQLARLCIAWLCVAACASAQEAVINGSREKAVQITRTSSPPTIDGFLDDIAWQSAAVIDDLHQIQPTEYAEPSEHTVIYVTYGDDALYVAARLYDSSPADITDRILRQGRQVFGDDWFSVMIDPFYDRRSGYRFLTNPNGIRQEGLYQNVSDTQWDWQGIWQAASSKNEEGWVTEIAIPFKSISFDPNNDTWGINFRRSLARVDERMGWVSRNRNTDPSTSGIAVGFADLRQGMGLDIVPSSTYRDTRSIPNRMPNISGTPSAPSNAPTVRDSEFDPSLDVFYKISPSLTAALTVNTDFSATDVDDRQVNLTRFSLFFPEKRDFFLQDADIFEFGSIDENGRPFFSRRIGLSGAGEAVDLDVGGKVSGRVGRFNIGALAIRQDEVAVLDSDDAVIGRVAADNAIVARVSANLLSESSIGFIATEGDPRSDVSNSVTGIDFKYRNSRLPGGRLLETHGWMQQSDTAGITGNDQAYGMRIRFPSNSGIRTGMRYTHIEENFNPALGFVNRRGIDQLNTGLQFTARPRRGYIRSILGGINYERVERLLDGAVESERFRLRMFELEGRQGDELQLQKEFRKEVLFTPFEITDGIVIPQGTYKFSEYAFEFSTADQRKIWGNLNFRSGDFYTGTRDGIGVGVSWRPSGRLLTAISYEYNDINLAEGDFETRLATFRTEIAFSATLSWVTFIQYDNLSETAGINSRVHWIPQAGREAFLVINHNLQDFDRDNRFKSAFSEAAVKFSYTFRF